MIPLVLTVDHPNLFTAESQSPRIERGFEACLRLTAHGSTDLLPLKADCSG
jgi:hypothetical protein